MIDRFPSSHTRDLLFNAMRNPRVILSFLLTFFGLGFVFYYDMPIVRNSLLYAKMTYALSDPGVDFSVSEHAFNKALGFPVLSLPMTMLFGANVGLKVSSFLWSALWALSIVFFVRHLKRVFCWDPENQPNSGFFLIVLLLNPLVYYQFLSAYPDTLNALTFLWALFFLDRMFSKENRWFHPILFSVMTLIAIWVKHHGFILLAILLVFGICRLPVFKWQWTKSRGNLFLSLLSLSGMLFIIWLAQNGHIPIFNLSQNTGNYSGGFHEVSTVLWNNVNNLKYYLGLSFTCLVFFLFRWKSIFKYKEWYLTILLFVTTILLYHGAKSNIRYFLPIAPLLAWIICNNLMGVNRKIRILFLSAFISVNLFFTLYLNNIPIKTLVDRVHSFGKLDNLRLVGQQYETQKMITAINNLVSPERNTLFFARHYYGKGIWQVWEREGLFSKDLNIVYILEPDWAYMINYAGKHGLKQAILYTRFRKNARTTHSGVEQRKIARMGYVLTFK